MATARVVIRRDALKAWLQSAGGNNVWLAQQLSVTPGRISQLLNSDVSPSAQLMGNLLVLTKLPFERLFHVVFEEEASPAVKPSLPHEAPETAPLEVAGRAAE